MTINGGVKFFEPSQALLNTITGGNATATASSGTASANFPLDKNEYTIWRSIGSDDLTTETWTVTLSSPVSFNRIFLIDHNFKEYNIQYFDGTWKDFVLVFGLDGAISGGIYETDFTDDSAYYEHLEVTTDQIRIQVTKTQIADEEKFLESFVITSEIGTLEGFPNISQVSKDKNLRKRKTLNGRTFVQKSLETRKFNLSFKDYPATLTADLSLIIYLFDRDDSFLVWLCGGRRGAPYFKFQFAGFRLRDLINMQVINKFNDKYRKNFYNGQVSMRLLLEESF